MSPGFNYATYFGIDHVAPAIIFAVSYAVLLGYLVFRALRQPAYLLNVLSIFCGLRIAAFVIRAVLASSDAAGQHVVLYIIDGVLFTVGFVALLHSAFIVVLHRESLLQPGEEDRLLLKVMQDRRGIRFAVVAAIVCGVTGINFVALSTSQGYINIGNKLLMASAGIFFVLAVIQSVFAVVYIKHEVRASKDSNSKREKATSLGLLWTISVLLLIRGCYTVGTSGNITKSGDEGLWYPFLALTELAAAVIFAIPGLISNDSISDRPATLEMRV